MKFERQLKIALDESRLLILGSQVLFGFQFNGIFQQQFDELPPLSRAFVCAGLTLIMLAVALLIAPSMDHRIIERGQDTTRVLALVARRGAVYARSLRQQASVEQPPPEGAEMPAFFINDPAHWRQRAEEARTIAEQMSDLQSKDSMLRIAKDYERLAERAEQRGKGSGRAT
jgi:hypothetical protein